MKRNPLIDHTHRYFEPGEADPLDIGNSVVAVMNETLVQTWLSLFQETATNRYAYIHCCYATTTQVFDIDGQRLVVVCDAGGDFITLDFENFCKENALPSQYIPHSLDCTGVAPENIFTGLPEEDTNLDLLTLVHKIYN